MVTIEAEGSGGEGGTGTGFVFDKQGHILTNNHVVASGGDGGKLSATFSDGKKYDAEVVGKAQGYDVAVIKLKNAADRNLNPLALGNSDKVRGRRLDHRDRRALRPLEHGHHRHHQRQEPPGRLQRRRRAATPRT